LANIRIDPKIVPHRIEDGVELPRVGGGLDSGGAYQAGKRSRGIGAAGKPENVDLVAGRIVLGEVPIGLLDDLPQADADGPAERVLQEVGVAADAFMVEGDLPGAVGGPGLDQGRAGLRIVRSSLAMLVSLPLPSSFQVPSIRLTMRFMRSPRNGAMRV
jgi:hypothetical protein